MNFEDFPRWGAVEDGSDPLSSSSIGVELSKEKRFPVCPQLNAKLVLFKGNIEDVPLDAIVNPTNESISSQHGVSFDILQRGGPELAQEILLLDGCKTGHAKSTSAPGCAAKRIIHTVGPRFNEKYRTAAVNALHMCYRNTLQVAREEKLRSLALSVVHSQRKGYPPQVGAHVALRTIRRYLEHYPDAFDTVAICTVEGKVDFGVYKRILPLYFPRNAEEFAHAQRTLPDDCGDEWGETQIAERQIRISVAPATGGAVRTPEPAARRLPTFGNESTMIADDQLRPTMLATMTKSDDEARRRAVLSRMAATSPSQARAEQYERWRAVAAQEDLSDVARLGCVFRGGPDKQGHDILILLAGRMPAQGSGVGMDRVLLYALDILGPLSSSSAFNLVYIQSGATSATEPSFAWMRKLLSVLEWPQGSRMMACHFVGVGFMWKAGFSLSVAPFFSASFRDKIDYCDTLSRLYSIYPKNILNVPI